MCDDGKNYRYDKVHLVNDVIKYRSCVLLGLIYNNNNKTSV